MTEHIAPNGTIYFHNAALSGQANSMREGEQKRVCDKEPVQQSRKDSDEGHKG